MTSVQSIARSLSVASVLARSIAVCQVKRQLLRNTHTLCKHCAGKQTCRQQKQRLIRATMSNFAGKEKDYIFRQLLDYKSYTYTYLLADAESGEAILIDPVVEMVDRDVHIVQDMGLKLIYAVNTHVHADHITGTGEIKKKLPGCKSVIAGVSGAHADVKIGEGDEIKFGRYKLECRNTPGHTNGCMTYVWHDKGMAFTGDAVLIRGCGRTDFQQGDAEMLYTSVHNKIFSLPEEFMLYPAHDYTGQTVTTVEEEKRFNPRLTKSKSEFVRIMKELNLPYPKQIGQLGLAS